MCRNHVIVFCERLSSDPASMYVRRCFQTSLFSSGSRWLRNGTSWRKARCTLVSMISLVFSSPGSLTAPSVGRIIIACIGHRWNLNLAGIIQRPGDSEPSVSRVGCSLTLCRFQCCIGIMVGCQIAVRRRETFHDSTKRRWKTMSRLMPTETI
ncbi:hypothetical protein EV421DRAFT_1201634 [Armillaria borealis]|uniref:Uncharacterized protein n=1 Tax=Armillaria borealis TaxID=47425 RepID=A0AA39MY51_9AGAR|nr:hypothetical protein EV421DRAFT_1201634 [Armillaria borealis]